MKIKKSRLLTIIQEEISRLDEAPAFRDDPEGEKEAEKTLARVQRGGMLGSKLAPAAIEMAQANMENPDLPFEEREKAFNALASDAAARFVEFSGKKSDDAMQQALLQAFEYFLGKGAGLETAKFETWIKSVADKRFIDNLRKFAREKSFGGSQGEPGEASIGDISDASQDDTVFYPIRQKILDPLQALIQKQNFEKYGDSAVVSDLLPDKDKKTFEQLMKFIEEKGLDTTGSATGGKKYSKSIVNQEQFGRFISPDVKNLPYSTAQSAGRRALESLEAALARAGKKLKQQGNLEETIKATILEMDDDSSDLSPGLVPADDDLRDSIRADVDKMHPGLKDWNQDVYEGLVDFITSNYEAEDADLRKDGYLPPKGPEFDYVGYEDPGSLGKLGDLKEAIKEALKDLI